MNRPAPRRRPQAFTLDDDRLEPDRPDGGVDAFEPAGDDAAAVPGYRPSDPAPRPRWFGWGSILLSALAGLALLALTTWATQFVLETLARNDIAGWIAVALLSVAAVAFAVIIARELLGLMRLRRLRGFRQRVEAALALGDATAERGCVREMKDLYRGRRDMSWALDRFGAHERDISDPGDLLKLAERDLIAPLDAQARALIVQTAKRVSLATAISPFALFDMAFVLASNLSMLRKLASLYGARPGFLGGLRLGRMVIGHIIATGGLALSDDLIGQFLGHDLVRRLSRRLGEGVFNGAITARIGIAAIDLCRPLPFIEGEPVRLRDLVSVIFRGSTGAAAPSAKN